MNDKHEGSNEDVQGYECQHYHQKIVKQHYLRQRNEELDSFRTVVAMTNGSHNDVHPQFYGNLLGVIPNCVRVVGF